MRVIKRDGIRKEDYNGDKIVKAIVKAMKSTGSVNMELAKEIESNIFESIKNNKEITICEIQMLVEEELMSSERRDVARNYIEYRHWRDEQRQNKELDNFITDVIDLNNLENENANMDENVFTSKKERVVTNVLEDYATRYLLTPRVRRAKEDNIIYIHDYDSYAIGMHNCLLVDLDDILKKGFTTQNGDVRPPRSISSAMQLTAVVLQCISNEQFGGVSVANLDYDLAPYVAISFKKLYKELLMLLTEFSIDEIEDKYGSIEMSNLKLKSTGNDDLDKVFKEANKKIEKVTLQSAEGLIHNLNTLQSRSGNQLPFTSVNYGTDTSAEGRLVSKSVLKARLDGVGKNKITPIFPIGIFKHQKGVNAEEGDPNYDIKQLAIESTSKRIYPNFANVDAPHLAEPTSKHLEFATINITVA